MEKTGCHLQRLLDVCQAGWLPSSVICQGLYGRLTSMNALALMRKLVPVQLMKPKASYPGCMYSQKCTCNETCIFCMQYMVSFAAHRLRAAEIFHLPMPNEGCRCSVFYKCTLARQQCCCHFLELIFCLTLTCEEGMRK